MILETNETVSSQIYSTFNRLNTTLETSMQQRRPLEHPKFGKLVQQFGNRRSLRLNRRLLSCWPCVVAWHIYVPAIDQDDTRSHHQPKACQPGQPSASQLVSPENPKPEVQQRRHSGPATPDMYRPGKRCLIYNGDDTLLMQTLLLKQGNDPSGTAGVNSTKTKRQCLVKGSLRALFSSIILRIANVSLRQHFITLGRPFNPHKADSSNRWLHNRKRWESISGISLRQGVGSFRKRQIKMRINGQN